MSRDIIAIIVIGVVVCMAMVYGDYGKEVAISSVSGLLGYLSKTPKK